MNKSLEVPVVRGKTHIPLVDRGILAFFLFFLAPPSFGLFFTPDGASSNICASYLSPFLYIVGIGGVGILSIVAWNYLLNKKVKEKTKQLELEFSRRKQSEEELKLSVAVFKAVFELSPLSIYVSSGPDQKAKLINDHFHKTFGYFISDVPTVGHWWIKAFPEEEYRKQIYDQWADNIKKAEQDNNDVEAVECICTCKDGSTRIIKWVGKTLGDDFWAFGYDITDTRESENRIAAEKERLSVTLRSIGDGVITTDTLGNIVSMNRVAEILCGWITSEAEGKPLSSVFRIVDQYTRKPLENPVHKVLASRKSVEFENNTILIAKDSTEKIIEDSCAPINDKNNLIIGVVLVFRDMTDKYKSVENMQRNDRLNSIGVLAGGIAHDFNNLLAGIFGYVSLARDRCSNDPVVSNFLEKALRVFTRAKDLTQQLLTFSKGGAPTMITGHIGKLIQSNAAFVLSGKNVACEYHIEDDLWLADFDENQLGQVIDNIVLNAQQAMPNGGKIVFQVKNVSFKECKLSGSMAGDYVKVSIEDTGVGIPQEIRKQIFDPFFSTKPKGSGLGLATCHSIVKKHEGFIEVESEPGKGSTFHIYLPASKKIISPVFLEQSQPVKGTGSILVMDDEDFVREILGNILESMGFQMVEATHGVEALQICKEAKTNGIKLVGAIFDLTIPGGKGGKEIVKDLRIDYPDLPVFASSGYSEDPIISHPGDFGFTGSIKKPFKKEELAQLLRVHLKAI